MCLGGCLYAQRLVRALVIVEVDPVADRTAGMGHALEPLPVHALLLQAPDHPLDHPVLLGQCGVMNSCCKP